MPQNRFDARHFICEYAHHVPGRLRLKLLAPSRGSAAANAACRKLTIPAALSTTPNLLTGSLVFHYDSAMISPTALCAAVERLGFVPASAVGAAVAANSIIQRVGDAAAGKLFEYVLESLALAAIEAAI